MTRARTTAASVQDAARRARWSDDAGITLAELLVAMVIMSMVVIATITLTVGMQRTDASTWGRSDDTTAAQYAIRVATRTLPYALHPDVYATAMTSPVLEGSGSRIAVVVRDPTTTATSAQPAVDELVLVELELADERLVERRTALADVPDADTLRGLLPLSGSCAARACETRVLVDGVMAGSGLDYRGADGQTVGATGDVGMVDLTLVVRTDPRRQTVASTHRERIHLKND